MQKIGNIFIRPLELDLLPSVSLDSGVYEINVSATLIRPDDPYMYETQVSNWYTKSDLTILVGDDVYGINYAINSVDRYTNVNKHLYMLKSDLILLNLANKLIF